MIRLLATAACCVALGACAAPAEEGPATLPPPGPGEDASVPPPPPVIVGTLPSKPELPPAGSALAERSRLGWVKGQARIELQPAGSSQLGEVRAVALTLELRDAVGPVPVVLELTAPGGLPFQRFRQEVIAQAGRPVEAEFMLPVAGTLIQRAQMHGTWSAEFEVKGRKIAVATFEVRP